MSPDRATADRFSEHLDAIVSGVPTRPESLDPVMTETAARFFAADDAPPPPPGLADRVWEDLLRQQHARTHDGQLAGSPAGSERAMRPSPARHVFLLRQPSPASTNRMLAFLATAALVVLALAGALVATRGPIPLPGQEELSASLPAISGGADMTSVMETSVAEWPTANPLLFVTLRRETLDPGAEEEFGVAGVTGDSLDLFIVESGQVTVDADGPMFLWRGSTDPGSEPDALPAGSSIVLDPGDSLYLPVGTAGRRHNEAAEPAVFMGFQMTQLELLLHPAGVTNVRIVPDKILNVPPQAPATLSLYRLRLAPGEQWSLLALPGLEMLYVETGTLDLKGARRLGDLAPESWKSIPAGQGMAHFETTTALANSGVEPVTVLLVTIEPVP